MKSAAALPISHNISIADAAHCAGTRLNAATIISSAAAAVMATTTSTSSAVVIARRAAVAQLRLTNDKRANLLQVAKCAGWAKRHGAQMLFLPECLGFMGENAEQTLKAADPPPIIVTDGQSCCTTTPFRQVLSETIKNAEFGYDDDDHEQPLTPAIASSSSSTSSSTFSIIDELRYIASKSKLWISGGGVHTKVLTNHQSTTTSAVTTKVTTFTNPDTIIGTEDKIYNTHVIIDDKGKIQAHYHKIRHLFDVSLPDKKVELCESNATSPGTKLVVCDSPVGKLGLSIC